MKYIREATDEEVKDMSSEIKINLFNKYYWHFIGEDFFEKLSKQDGGWGRKYMTILDNTNNPVGLIQITRKIPRNIAVLGIVVYEKDSSYGYGTRAFREALELCKQIGINNILIDTTSTRLCEYYKKLGFADVGCFKKRVKLPDNRFYDKYFLQLIT